MHSMPPTMSQPKHRHNGKSPIHVVEETITPAAAAELLVGIKNVRKVRNDHVALLAEAMRSGMWERNGSTLKKNAEGLVVDGEHRLRACIRAGVPFTTLVAYGIEASATIDTGARPRTMAQLVAASGVKNSSIVASIARLAVVLEEAGNLERLSAGAARLGVTVQRVAAYVDKHFDELQDAAALARDPAVASGLPSGALGLVAFIAAKNPLLHPFLEGVRTGESLRKGNPAYALRERSLNLGRRSRMHYTDACACVFKAWNAYARKEPMQLLRWTGVAEKIQTPIA